MTLRIGHLPGLDPAALAWQALPLTLSVPIPLAGSGEQVGDRFGRAGAPNTPGLQLEAARPDVAQLQQLIDHLRGPGRAALRAMPVNDIAAAIDAAVHRLLDDNDPDHRLLMQTLPQTTGFAPEMVRLTLNGALRSFRAMPLQRLMAGDLGDPAVLDGFRPRMNGGWTRAQGPDLLVHVWAGNVPALPLWSMVCGLLAKAGNLGRVSAGEPVFASVFASVLKRVEPRLAEAFAVLWWSHDDPDADLVWRAADTVLAYGGDAALDALRSRLPGHVRWLPHGHRISLGVVAQQALDAWRVPDLVRRVARDLVRHEQQGCYSPQALYVQRGGAIGTLEFAQRLASALGQLAPRFPRPALDLGDAAGVAAWRDARQWQALTDNGLTLLGQAGDSTTVVHREKAVPLSPGPLHRCIEVVAIDRFDELPDLLAPCRRHLQTVGVAAAPEELLSLGECLAAAGATRLTALGEMTSPAPGWQADGRPSLSDLLRFVDLEASAEQLADGLTGYEP